MRVPLTVLALAAVLSVPLFAQQLSEAVTVEVVDVPVFVTRAGTPVEGLTREDFELFVNGKRHPFDYFDVVTTSAAKDAEDLRQRRLFLLLFDLAFTDIHGLERARRAAMKLVGSAPAGDLFAVGTYSSRRGIWIAAPFTRDPATLTHAIGTLSSTRSGDPLALVMTTAETARAGGLHAPEPVDLIGDDLPGGVTRLANAAQEDIALTVAQRFAEDQVLDLRDVAQRLASLQGQKHVVLMSSGFDGSNRTQSIRAASNPTSFVSYEGGVSPVLEGAGLGGRVFRAVKDLARAYQAADVFLHTVDLEGLTTLDANHALFTLAAHTDGTFIHSENDPSVALRRLSTAYGHSYVLGFVPRSVRKGDNRIEVRLRNARGATVHHRRGFSGAQQPTDVDEGLYLADVVMNDVPQTGTAASLTVEGMTLSATIPMAQLAPQVTKERRAELLVYFFDAQGAALEFRREVIDVPPAPDGDMTIAIAVPEGATIAKALLRVNGSLGFSRAGV